MKQTVIAIVGPSGSGKTTLAEHLKAVANIPTIVSWTTREMRKGEKSGREHWFANYTAVPPHEFMIAHTVFGGNHYWVTHKDIEDAGPVVTYVIDERGLLMLQEHADKYNVVPILIQRDEDKLIKAVGINRVRRDLGRTQLDKTAYKYIITNNGKLTEFLEKGMDVVAQIIQTYDNTNN